MRDSAYDMSLLRGCDPYPENYRRERRGRRENDELSDLRVLRGEIIIARGAAPGMKNGPENYRRERRGRRENDELSDLRVLRGEIIIARGDAPGMKNCLVTLKARCFTGDLPQRTLNGRPVHGKAVTIARVPCWGHMLPCGMGNSQ
jgi:hypothetical protein